jgi:hypothetical protein
MELCDYFSIDGVDEDSENTSLDLFLNDMGLDSQDEPEDYYSESEDHLCDAGFDDYLEDQKEPFCDIE